MIKQTSVPFLITLTFLIFSCDNNTSNRISKLEGQIDSLRADIKILRKEISDTRDTLLTIRQSANQQGQKSNTPQLQIPFFINKTMSQIKSYWETRISIEYFDEGTYDDSKEKYFDIMVGNIGSPEFSATFDKQGLCKEHSTKISFSDISVMQARLKNAGYLYDQAKKCWILSGQNHTWRIDGPFGQDYQLECKRN